MILGEQTLTRKRYDSPGGWSGGLFDKGEAEETSFRGAFHPSDWKAMQSLTEGERASDVRYVITDSIELRTADQHAGTQADEIVDADDVVYQVRKVEVFPAVLPHTEAVVVRLAETEAVEEEP